MDLKCTINILRRKKADLDKIYLILALLESHADDTPFFAGLDEKELVLAVYLSVSFHEQYFNNELLDEYSQKDFLGFLASQKEFKVDLSDLSRIYNNIKTQGEEHYGFKRFDRMDKRSPKEGQLEARRKEGQD